MTDGETFERLSAVAARAWIVAWQAGVAALLLPPSQARTEALVALQRLEHTSWPLTQRWWENPVEAEYDRQIAARGGDLTGELIRDANNRAAREVNPCVCGHGDVEHYDGYSFCTWIDVCDCEKFRPRGEQ